MEWLFVDEVSKRYSLTERAIREKAYKGDFGDLDKGHRLIKGKGRGGKQIQIALESLPKAAQARYHGEKQPHEDILQYTGKQRIEADFRALVVLEYQHSSFRRTNTLQNSTEKTLQRTRSPQASCSAGRNNTERAALPG